MDKAASPLEEMRRCVKEVTGETSGLVFRYFSLIYTLFFLIDPIQRHSAWHWWLLAGTFAVFLALYLIIPKTHGPTRLVLMLCFFAIGFAYIPFNQSAAGIVVYPMGMLPFLVRDVRKVIVILLADIAAIGLEGLLLHLNLWTYGLGIFLVVAVTLSNLYYAQQKESNRRLSLAHDEIENLAKLAERERIARDLHDLLGHTLTLVVLKSELAERLIEADPAAAKHEVAEIQQTARKALAEVREAVLGYRSQGLPAEIQRAQHTLHIAGIALQPATVDASIQDDILPEQESVLTLALREAITNIVRHSRATQCSIHLVRQQSTLLLTVHDNGVGIPAITNGFGLRGMRERVEAANGTLDLDQQQGTTLRVRLPLPTRASETATPARPRTEPIGVQFGTAATAPGTRL